MERIVPTPSGVASADDTKQFESECFDCKLRPICPLYAVMPDARVIVTNCPLRSVDPEYLKELIGDGKRV